MIRAVLRSIPFLLLVTGALSAQEAGAFTITRGSDTVAQEQFQRAPGELSASLTRLAGAAARERLHYKAALLPDASAPLIEVSVWRADDPEGVPARQTARVIFKDDSVAVDQADQGGVKTLILPTTRAAIVYLNLSVALLEQATRRVESSKADSVPVPFFNLGGGQTVTGIVRRIGSDSAAIRIGAVEFRLSVDGDGRILGGAVPSQGLRITRGAGR